MSTEGIRKGPFSLFYEPPGGYVIPPGLVRPAITGYLIDATGYVITMTMVATTGFQDKYV